MKSATGPAQCERRHPPRQKLMLPMSFARLRTLKTLEDLNGAAKLFKGVAHRFRESRAKERTP